MKILFMTPECSDDVSWSNMHYLEQAVAKIAECEWSGRGHAEHIHGEDLNDTIRRVMPGADWVIIYDRAHTRFKNAVKIPEKRICKVAYSISDIHWNPPATVKRLNDAKWDAVLMQTTKTVLGSVPRTKKNRALRLVPIDPNYYLKNLKPPIFHLAHSINPEIFKPLKKPKVFDVSFLGAHQAKFYPLRANIWQGLPELARRHGWRVLMKGTPPGKSLVSRNISVLQKQGHIVGRKYAEALALSKTFPFSVSTVKYAIKKFVEGMACGACCLSDIPITAKELHYVPDQNFVSINTKNWRTKLIYYMKHNGKREEIVKRGYETVMKYHTTDVRARQLVKFLEEYS